MGMSIRQRKNQLTILLRSFSPPTLFAIGAILGISVFAILFPQKYNFNACGNNNSKSKLKDAGTLLAQLLPQPRDGYPQPRGGEKFGLQPKYKHFKELPGNWSDHPILGWEGAIRKRYYMPCNPLKRCHYPQRALRQLGWTKVNEWENATARLVWSSENQANLTRILNHSSYQRYNHLPEERRQHLIEATAFRNIIHTPEIISHTKLTKKKNKTKTHYHGKYNDEDEESNKMRYFPPSYRLRTEEERKAAMSEMGKDKAYWLLQNSAGQTINVINSRWALKANLDSHSKTPPKHQNDYLSMTRYVCNQLTWNGLQFMVRIFWLTASLDPLLVLYQDGYVRIGYDRVNSYYLKGDDEVVNFNDLEALLWTEWKQSRSLRRSGIQDPMLHVRNQFKEAIVALVDNFRNTTFAPIHRSKDYVEDGFELMAADFTIDRDLDVHLMATYSDTDPYGGNYQLLMEDYYFLVQKNHELWYGMLLTLEEIWDKQERDLESGVLPLLTTGKFQLIVAGDKWKFQYNLPSSNMKYDDEDDNGKKKKRRRKKTKCPVHENRKRHGSALHILGVPPKDEYDEDAIGEGYEDEDNILANGVNGVSNVMVVMDDPQDPVEIPW